MTSSDVAAALRDEEERDGERNQAREHVVSCHIEKLCIDSSVVHARAA
jgi:hypothetical protein